MTAGAQRAPRQATAGAVHGARFGHLERERESMETTVDIGPITLADAMRARDVLASAGGDCAPLAAMLALRIAQSENAAVLELRCELERADSILPPAVPALEVRPAMFPTRPGVPVRWA